jgi:hypothetical protein
VGWKMLEVDRYCFGEDHPIYQQELDIINKMETAVANSEPFDQSVKQYFFSRE